MNEAKEVLSATARLLNAVALQLEQTAKFTGDALSDYGAAAEAATRGAAETATEAAAKTRKPRAPKAPATARQEPPAPAAAPAAAPAVAMTEEQYAEKLKEVGEAFVQAFSKQGNPVKEVGEILATRFKVARLRELTHPQRVELIGILEARIREKDAALAQAPAPTGLEI